MYILLYILLFYLINPSIAELTINSNAPPVNELPSTTSFPITNVLDSRFSYATDAFPAIILPITFTPDYTCTPILALPLNINSTDTWVKNTRVLPMAEWRRDARVNGCLHQQMLVDRIELKLVPTLKKLGLDMRQWMPIFSGNSNNFADTASPYIAKFGTFDALAIGPDARDFILTECQVRGFVSVIVRRDPGPWNTMYISPSYLGVHWTIFTLNLILLVIAVWRTRLQLKIQREMIHENRDQNWGIATRDLLTSNDPQILLHFAALVYFGISLPGLVERLNRPHIQAISLFKWLLFIYALTAVKVTWCRVAYAVTSRKKYLIYKYFAVFVAVFATVFGLFFILSMVIPQLSRVQDWFIMGFLVGVPILLLVRGACFVIMSIVFLKQVAKERIGYLPLKRLQVLTANGILSSIAYFLALISGCLFLITSIESQTGYLIANMSICIAGIMAQAGVFILPTTNELVFNDMSMETEDETQEVDGDPMPMSEWKTCNDGPERE